MIYRAFFSSHLSYGVESFGLCPKGLLDPIFKIQKRAVRIVAGKAPREHTAPLFTRLKILPYPIFVSFATCLFIYKLLTNRIPKIIPLRLASGPTRGANSRLILLDHCHSNTGHYSTAVGGSVVWNNLPSHIRSWDGTLVTFKQTLSLHMFEKINALMNP